MDESITKAAQTANFIVSDLEEAWRAVRIATKARPEGKNLFDKATEAYLSQLIIDARALESKLLAIA